MENYCPYSRLCLTIKVGFGRHIKENILLKICLVWENIFLLLWITMQEVAS